LREVVVPCRVVAGAAGFFDLAADLALAGGSDLVRGADGGVGADARDLLGRDVVAAGVARRRVALSSDRWRRGRGRSAVFI
jgi:hypothetical protein